MKQLLFSALIVTAVFTSAGCKKKTDCDRSNVGYLKFKNLTGSPLQITANDAIPLPCAQVGTGGHYLAPYAECETTIPADQMYQIVVKKENGTVYWEPEVTVASCRTTILEIR